MTPLSTLRGAGALCSLSGVQGLLCSEPGTRRPVWRGVGALGYAGTPAADVTLFPRPALESPGPLLGGPWCQGTSR